MNKKDISNREDIESLVKLFYKKLLADETLSYIFTDIAKIDIESHLLLISDFWENIIFGADTYKSNAMQPHLELNKQTVLTKKHFDNWLKHFNDSIDSLFSGEKAHFTKNRAQSIATVMQVKIFNAQGTNQII